VISVIVYGRNDAHGYNLHRRAALSLNCIAEVLTEPDDEIVFVDYNTPDELPTFVEAIADTLTDRCLSRMRVFRVPAALHAERFTERTDLPALEPIARNAGVRRANPANRWLLLTNTDMIFVPLAGRSPQSMSEICGELGDGFYGLPRFELPEWLWERLPRSDPRGVIEEVARQGPRLCLDEITLSNEWVRFDAPGDFQLILREDYLAIDGLDEEMLLGYHVDSNLCKRMLLYRGSIETLEESVAGYHCNHNREPTVYHDAGIYVIRPGANNKANDLVRFFVAVDRSDLPEQRATWGLPDVEIEEVPLRERTGAAFGEALVAATPEATGSRVTSDTGRVPFQFSYDSGHVLPFVADSLAVSSLDSTIAYVGANPVLREMLAAVVERLGFSRPLEAAALDNFASLRQLARMADVFVVDLGLDASLVDADDGAAGDGHRQVPQGLNLTLEAMDVLVELERERLQTGSHPRRFVLVHSWTVFWDAHILANFDCSHMMAHSRVRRATVRIAPLDDETTREATHAERRLTRWYARVDSDRRRLLVRARETVSLAELRDYGGFGEGWSYPDEEGGIWTDGARAELSLVLDGIGQSDCVLGLSIGSVGVARDRTLTVKAHANGELAAVRDFRYGDPEWQIELPAHARTDDVVDLTFEIDEPTTPVALGWSAEDVRLLGINLRRLTLHEIDRSVRPGETVVFREGSGGERLLGGGWSHLEPSGVWTDGETASLVLRLEEIAGDAELVLAVEPFVTPQHRELALEISACGQPLGSQVFRHGRRRLRRTRARFGIGRPHQLVRVRLPVAVRDDSGRVVVDLRIADPASPRALGLSEDPRRLGVHLRWLALKPS
jgi:hypothetical protein